MKRPSFQFYPADWSANPNLKRCTFAEKGVWLEVMCLMHDQEEYGVLRWPLKEIAEAVKCRPADLQALLRKGVLKGDDTLLEEPFIYTPRSGRKDGEPVTLIATQAGPVWYSSRMVKDEHVRINRAEAGSKGEAPHAAPKLAPKPPNGAAFGPRGSSSSSSPSGNNPSEAIASAAAAALGSPSAAELTKVELWSAGKSLLRQQGMPVAQCGSFVGALVKAHGETEVVDAVRRAVLEQPADVASWLKGALKSKRPPANGKHAGFENKDYHAGVTSDGFIA